MKKRYKVEITRTAEDDVEDIWNHIAYDSIENATHFIYDIEKKIYSLEGYPLRNPVISECELLRGEYRHLVYKDYRIIYRVERSHVFVMRVIHGSRLLS